MGYEEWNQWQLEEDYEEEYEDEDDLDLEEEEKEEDNIINYFLKSRDRDSQRIWDIVYIKLCLAFFFKCKMKEIDLLSDEEIEQLYREYMKLLRENQRH